MSFRNKAILVLALQFLAFWPVWQWYGARVFDSADGKWGLLAAASAALLLCWKRATEREVKIRLWLPTLLLLLYAITYPFFPPLARAVVAVTAIGCTLSSLLMGRLFHTGVLGLLYLSLPIIPSLQFYGGYPLRVFVASVTAPILRLGGFNVFQDGTCLNWGGQLIWIDAPCSGVRMLWVGLYLACALATVYALRPLKTLTVLSTALIAVICGNIFRAVALFYLEARVIEMPAWSHDYVGVVAFALVATGITSFVWWLRREKLCAQTLSI
jgi:exosortase/archaeosortase family protein